MSNSNKDKSQLIEHLYSVLNTEMAKPYEEIDAELIEACVELILELQGKNFTLSNEEIDNLVRKIPFVEVADFEAARKKRKKTNKKKILLIAAIIAILCAVMVIMSSGKDWDIIEYVFEKYDKLHDIPTNEPITLYDEEIIFLEGEPVFYTDPEKFYENEGCNILLPTELPEGVYFQYMFVIEEKNTENTVIVVYTDIEGYGAHLNSGLPQCTKDVADKTYITEKGIVCYILYYDRPDDKCFIQIEFEHNGNYYVVTGLDNEQALLDMIESLEEIENLPDASAEEVNPPNEN